MKKFMSIMLGLGLILGSATVTLATTQEDPKPKKKKKKGGEEKKPATPSVFVR